MSSSSPRASAYAVAASASAAAAVPSTSSTASTSSPFDAHNNSIAVVILGGSSFIGRELTSNWPTRLSALGVDNARINGGVYAINRGNVYWNKKTPYAATVTHVEGNRGHTSSMTKAFSAVAAHVASTASAGANAAAVVEQDSGGNSPARHAEREDGDEEFSSLLDISGSAAAAAATDDAAAAAATGDKKKKSTPAASAGKQFWIIIDFSSSEPRDIVRVRNAVRNVNGDGSQPARVEIFHYVLISTDSVYNDSPPTGAAAADVASAGAADSASAAAAPAPFLVTEAHPMRDVDPLDFDENSYDESKALIELEVINSVGQERSTALRMADVIGPFDDTGRFWAMLTWVELAVAVPDSIFVKWRQNRGVSAAKTHVSFTLSQDVAAVLYKIVSGLAAALRTSYRQNSSSGSSISTGANLQDNNAVQQQNPHPGAPLSGAFNVACMSPITLGDFVALLRQSAEERKESIGETLREIQKQRFTNPPPSSSSSSSSDDSSSSSSDDDDDDDDSSDSSDDDGESDTVEYFPSVRCGPISCEKASRVLGWRPAPVVDAIKKTIEFFVNPDLRRTGEWKRTKRKLPKYMVDSWL